MTRLPDELRDILDDADPETLKATIEYADSQLSEEPSDSDDNEDEAPSEPPDEFKGDADAWTEAVSDTTAPSRATLTTKRINDNEYLYWQWSEDGSTKSEYIAPKNPN